MEQVDKVKRQIMTICSTLKKEAYLATDYKIQELKTDISSKVNQKMMALEMRLVHWMNEDRQTMAIRLQEINYLVATVRDG